MVAFPARDLKRSVPGADPARLRTLEALTSASNDTGLLPHLYRSLRVLLLHGDTTAASLAQSLAMHERTLARRLRAHGTTFRAVLDDVRHEAARQLLVESNLTVTRIASSLGYADGATFCKAFQRWSGKAPREWRVNARRARES
jgi:AraC-like DNA-binding protein